MATTEDAPSDSAPKILRRLTLHSFDEKQGKTSCCCLGSDTGRDAFGSRSALSLGQFIADWVSDNIGSWTFIMLLAVAMVTWMCLNVIPSSINKWDPFPFILLNLMLSFIAAYTAPIIMMSQNRSAEVDRVRNSSLHEKVDHIRRRQLLELWEEMQSQAAELQTMLSAMVDLHRTLRQSAASFTRPASDAKSPSNVVFNSSGVSSCPQCSAVLHCNSASNNVAQNTESQDLKTEVDALQSSIDDMRSRLAAYAEFDIDSTVDEAIADALPDLDMHPKSPRNSTLSPRKAARKPTVTISDNIVEMQPVTLHADVTVQLQSHPSVDSEDADKHAAERFRVEHTMTDGDDGLMLDQPLSSVELRRQRQRRIQRCRQRQAALGLSDADIDPQILADEAAEAEAERNMTALDRVDEVWRKCWQFCLFSSHYVDENISFGERLAEVLSEKMGSWSFVIGQTLFLIAWIVLNSTLNPDQQWDSYPFILLNLCLSAQAAFTAPIILMSQNRRGNSDQVHARELHVKVDHIRLAQTFALGDALQLQQHLLTRLRKVGDKVNAIVVSP